MHTLLLLFLVTSASASTPGSAQLAQPDQCCDTLVLDSLGRKIGDLSTVTPTVVRALRRTARKIADTSTCEVARDRAEEFAFDMSMVLADFEDQR